MNFAECQGEHVSAADRNERSRLFYVGAPMSIIPALLFLPALAYLVLQPSVAHARVIAWIAFPLMALAEVWGVSWLAMSCVRRPFGLFNVLSFGALIVLLVIMVCIGLFLAVFAAGIR